MSAFLDSDAQSPKERVAEALQATGFAISCGAFTSIVASFALAASNLALIRLWGRIFATVVCSGYLYVHRVCNAPPPVCRLTPTPGHTIVNRCAITIIPAILATINPHRPKSYTPRKSPELFCVHVNEESSDASIVRVSVGAPSRWQLDPLDCFLLDKGDEM